MHNNTLAVILAGQSGSALFPLTQYRTAAAVRFAGNLRLIDFPLANVFNSGLTRSLVLTTQRSEGLHRHLANTWQPAFESDRRAFLGVIANRQATGTVEALKQSLGFLEDLDPCNVLVLGSEQIALWDYRQLLDFHQEHGWGITLGCVAVPQDDLQPSHVLLDVDAASRVVSARDSFCGRPRSRAFVSVAAFSLERLIDAVRSAPEELTDFAADLIPHLVETAPVHAFEFTESATHGPVAWRDVGRLDAWFAAQQLLLTEYPLWDLQDSAWPLLAIGLDFARFDGSNLVAPNAVVQGRVHCSVIGPGCIVEEHAVVEDSILTHGVTVERGATIRRTVLDDHARVLSETAIGIDTHCDAQRGLTITPGGIAAVPSFHVIGTHLQRSWSKHRTTAAVSAG